MSVHIPVVPGNPLQTFQTVIMNRTYSFTFKWNARECAGKNADGTPRFGAWFFDVAEGDGTTILTSIKVVLGTRLGQNCNHELFRDCALIAHDTSQDAVEAGLDDLGSRVQLLHLTPNDLLLAQAPPFEVPAA